MKYALIIILVIASAINSNAQELPDSVYSKYHADSNKFKKGRVLTRYFNYDFNGTEDEKLALLLNVKRSFNNDNDPVGSDYCEAFIAGYAWSKADYALSLEKGLNILPDFEKRKDTFGIILVTNSLAISSSDSKNYTQAIEYLRKVLQYSLNTKEKIGVITSLNNMADNYNKLQQKDSALFYIQQAYQNLNDTTRPYYKSLVLTTMGEVYIGREEFDIAKPFIAKAINFSFETDDSATISYNYSSLAHCFFQQKIFDSSLHYAQRALQFAAPFYKAEMLRAAEWLYKNYEMKQNTDSLHHYYVMATELKDSMYSLDKIKSIQQLNFHEQLREQEKIAIKRAENDRRIKNLQLMGIAIFIITFISFVIIYKAKKTNSVTIEFLGILGVLLLFEFLSMMLHPFLERVTHHNPFAMLTSLVCLGAIIAPLHHNMTGWMKRNEAKQHKNVKKNTEKKGH